MTSKSYLILLLAFAGCTLAYPPNKQGHYVVTWTGDDEAASYQQQNHALLGSKMCTRGPAYWCHNITHAAECHAMEHCINKVWVDPKEKLPADNDSVCEVCLDMVKQARDQLLSNETQDELRQVLEGSCKLIPLKIVNKECCKLADDFIPELIDALTSRMDPQMVCHISGLCNSKRIDDMLAAVQIDGPKVVKPLNPDNLDTCPTCEFYVGEAENSLKKLTKKDLRYRLLDICGWMGSYTDACRQGVIHELDAIYEFVQKNNPKEVCSLIGLCTESSLHRVPLSGGSRQEPMTGVRVWQPPQGNKEDLECDFCKQLTVSVRNWLVANATEEEFQDVLKGLCKQTGKYKQECVSMAEQYGQQLYKALVEDLDPDSVCKAIGVCQDSLKRVQLAKDNGPVWTILKIDEDKKKDSDSDSSEETEDDDDDIIPLMKLVPGERLAGDDEIRPKVSSKAGCELCQNALHYLQDYLEDMKTEQEIRDKVDRLCTEYVPEAFVDQCKTFVEEYGDAVVVMLAQEVDPSQVCPKLRLCPAPTTPPTTRAVATEGDILPTCAICTFTIEKIIALAGKNLTKESIDNAMESICDFVPARRRDGCLSFMKEYGDAVAEMILIHGTSHGVCAALHLCIMEPRQTQPQKIVIGSPLPLNRYLPQTVAVDQMSQIEDANVNDDSRKCVMCEFVITTLDQRLQDNATEEQIKEEVESVCKYLPKTVQGKCKGFVDLYGEQIIQYLSQEIDPAEICQRIKLCQPQISNNDAIRDLKMNRCQLCMLVSDYLRSLVAEEEANQDIEHFAQRTCDMVPKSYRQQCTAMIEDYGSYLINILSKETDNGKACQEIQLCPNQLGGDIENNTIEEFEY